MKRLFSRNLLPVVPVLIAAASAGLASAPVVAAETTRASNQVIEEVTVTARKREERLIDTPVAVAVMTDADRGADSSRAISPKT